MTGVITDENYVLATGAEAEYRLKIVNDVHGPDSKEFLERAGLGRGQTDGLHVADIGCGVGKMTRYLAELYDQSGSIIGLDASAGQIAQARKLFTGVPETQVRFVAANAYETGLPSDSFDMVYSRFLLMHVARSADVLTEMKRILKPGGVLAVEDGDFASPFCYPPSAAYDRCFALYRLAGEREGADFRIGVKLPNLVAKAGFEVRSLALAQPLLWRGDAKRLPEWTLAECAPALLAADLATQEEIRALTTELQRLAANERTQFGMARMTQIVAYKPK